MVYIIKIFNKKNNNPKPNPKYSITLEMSWTRPFITPRQSILIGLGQIRKAWRKKVLNKKEIKKEKEEIRTKKHYTPCGVPHSYCAIVY